MEELKEEYYRQGVKFFKVAKILLWFILLPIIISECLGISMIGGFIASLGL